MRKTNCNLSRERLQEVLDYDPDTGIFKWKASRKGVTVGAVTGKTNSKGYRQIGIDMTLYLSHRLAWVYMTGVWSAKEIDHINGVKVDNRFINLREATATQNQQNSRSSRGSSVFRGVSWSAYANKWNAKIRLNGKSQHLGYFEDENEAAEAYQSAQRRLHPFAPDSDRFGNAT